MAVRANSLLLGATGVRPVLASYLADSIYPDTPFYPYYPDSLAGRDQAFKFINGAEGWESRDNRSFTIPQNDSTLRWLYFNDSTPLSGISAAWSRAC